MTYMCASRFHLEEQQLELLDDFLSEEEKQEATEEKSAELLDDLNPISDDEDNAVLVHEQCNTTAFRASRREEAKECGI